MFSCLLFVSIVIVWMPIGYIVSIIRGIDPHEYFYHFMLEALLWPVGLYLICMSKIVEIISNWFAARRVK